ncbi:VanW family protein [Massilia sp. TSP1-1-2]|uniref:VanW family protein n=1 Tax=Massilia sp. TSP1-1-2 TaxID=2804649 RepID=UPI003CF431F3
MDNQSSTREQLPTRVEAAVFGVKASLLRLKRTLTDALYRDVKRWRAGRGRESHGALVHLWSESVSTLDASGGSERRALVLGKIENLRVALRSIDGVQVPAGGLFSFWAQVGRARRWRGYVPGRELREGCIIAAIGGGLCQLSNALYQAALDAGLTIVERHAHSQVIPGSAAQANRDATVFWNYIDLRFSADEPFRMEAELDAGQLKVRIFKAHARAPVRAAATSTIVFAKGAAASARSCHSCGESACFRRVNAPATLALRSVFMVDALWPEFDAWIAATRLPGDCLMLPVDGRARGKAQYGWSTEGFARVATFPLLVLWRAFASRRLATQGAARQASAHRFRRRLAKAYVKTLGYMDEHVVVTQELLPYVWQLGALQGRSFDVLMTGLPMVQLQAVLDEAYGRHPHSKTLADFRAPAGLAELERLALARARTVVTPHAQVAALFANARLLEWAPAAACAPRKGTKIAYPAATLGRKGAYELRAAARELGLTLTLMGPVLEAPGFWDGVAVERSDDARGLDDVAVMVLPAWIASRPGLLLQALASGIAVIATSACGLPPQANLTLVPVGDVAALTDALRPFGPRNVKA